MRNFRSKRKTWESVHSRDRLWRQKDNFANFFRSKIRSPEKLSKRLFRLYGISYVSSVTCYWGTVLLRNSVQFLLWRPDHEWEGWNLNVTYRLKYKLSGILQICCGAYYPAFNTPEISESDGCYRMHFMLATIWSMQKLLSIYDDYLFEVDSQSHIINYKLT